MTKILFVLFVMLPGVALSQASIYLKLNVGTYAMEEMKSLQTVIANGFYERSGQRPTTNSQFPASLQGEGGMDFQRRKWSLGFFINYTATTGRMTGSDFIAGQRLERFMLGAKVARKVYKDFKIYFKVGGNQTTLDVETTGSKSEYSEYHNRFVSDGLTLEPGLSWAYPVHRFRLLAEAGYEFSTSTVLRRATGKEISMYLGHDEIVGNRRADWSGVRVGLGIGFVFGRERKAWVDPNLKSSR